MTTVVVRRNGVFISQQTLPPSGIDSFLASLHAEPDTDGLAATILREDGTSTCLAIH